MKKILIFLLMFTLFFPKKDAFGELRLNEIYPAPPFGEYEWVELYNDENSVINLKNFYLTDSSDKKILITSELIQPFSYILASTPSGILNNSNQTGKNYADIVYLHDSKNQVIEIATYSGSFDSEKTYAKCPDGTGNWFVLNSATKNSSNNSACSILTPTPISTPSVIPTPTIEPSNNETIPNTPTPEPTPLFYDHIYLSEVMPNPSSGSKEWVELYNDNAYEVVLANWYIDDYENSGSSPKTINTSIPAKSYAVIELGSSMFNNDKDAVRLLDWSKTEKDGFEYSSTQQNISYGRVSFDSDEFCLQQPTKGSKNNICIISSTTPIPASSDPITVTPTTKPATAVKKALPAVSPRVQSNRTAQPTNDTSQTGEILGVANSRQLNNPFYRIRLLSFLPLSYSLLTIISILVKMKKGL